MVQSPFPPGAPARPVTSRWIAWFVRYIDTPRERKRRRLLRHQLEAIDARILKDTGITQAQRFIAINQPFKEM
jgi:uncharacterized protein YjiS (DUF1127 family)